ncbi:MAG: TonB family protein [Burkholderiales bacterium]|nr:TonB family protein [Burkholderiales bacterium]
MRTLPFESRHGRSFAEISNPTKAAVVSGVFFAHLALFGMLTVLTDVPRRAVDVTPVDVLFLRSEAPAMRVAPANLASSATAPATKPKEKVTPPQKSLPHPNPDFLLPSPKTETVVHDIPDKTPPSDTLISDAPTTADDTASASASGANTPARSDAPSDAGEFAAYPNAKEIRYRVKPAPIYPPRAAQLKEEGRVIVRVLIDENGAPKTARVMQSSGFKRLDDAALNAVSRARFYPYEEGGRAYAAWADVPIAFALPR